MALPTTTALVQEVVSTVLDILLPTYALAHQYLVHSTTKSGCFYILLPDKASMPRQVLPTDVLLVSHRANLHSKTAFHGCHHHPGFTLPGYNRGNGCTAERPIYGSAERDWYPVG